MIPRLIDEIPIITVAASVAKGTTTITGLKGFKTKESGKLSRMIAELSKLGATLHETEDGVIIEGKEHLKGTVVEVTMTPQLPCPLCGRSCCGK